MGRSGSDWSANRSSWCDRFADFRWHPGAPERQSRQSDRISDPRVQPYLLEISNRARNGETLDPSDHRVYVIFVLTAARLAQSAHYQSQLRLLDKSKLKSVVYNLVRHLQTVPGAVVWSELADRSDPEFRRYVETMAARIDSFDTLMTPHSPANESGS